MISAYFLSATQKRRFIKVVELIGQVIAFQVAYYLVTALLGYQVISLSGIVRAVLPANYFVILYLVLYVISPYINVMIKNISKENFKRIVIILFFIFSVWTICDDFLANLFGRIQGLNTVGLHGDQESYTIVNFTLVYIIGAYIRLNNISMTKRKSVMGIIACILLIYFEQIAGEAYYGTSLAWRYCNPIVILLPVFVILLFTKLEINSKVNLQKRLLPAIFFMVILCQN